MLLSALIGTALGIKLSGGLKDINETKQIIKYKKLSELAKKNGITIPVMESDEFVKISPDDKPNKKPENNESIDNIKKELVPSPRVVLSDEEYYDSKAEYYQSVNENIESKLKSKNVNLHDEKNKLITGWLSSDNKCTDGKDDGKISFWSKVGNCLEGVAKTVVGTLYDITSDPKKLAVTALGAVGSMVLSTNPVGLCVVTVLGLIGGFKLIKAGVKNIIAAEEKTRNAATDAEAKDAWEKIGQGGTQVIAGRVVVYTSACSAENICIKSPQVVAAENAQIYRSWETFGNAALEETTKAIIDPSNIDDAA